MNFVSWWKICLVYFMPSYPMELDYVTRNVAFVRAIFVIYGQKTYVTSKFSLYFKFYFKKTHFFKIFEIVFLNL